VYCFNNLTMGIVIARLFVSCVSLSPKYADGALQIRSRLCTVQECRMKAKYGDMKIATHCTNHSLEGQKRIVTSRAGRCQFPEGCVRIATCGDPRYRKAKYCAQHKGKGHQNIACRRCEHPGCPGYASFDPGQSGRRRFCGQHRGPTEAKKRPICQHPAGCVRQPTFGDEEEHVRRFCSRHRRPEDTYLVGGKRKCEAPNCCTSPTFGLPKDLLPRFCKQHRLQQHIPVRHVLCETTGCSRRAYYAESNETASRCRQHRLVSQFHVGTRCQSTGCFKTAQHTDGKTRSRRFCDEHKAAHHVPLVKPAGRRCQHPEGCSAQPSFGPRAGGERLYCARHKGATHVNTVGAVFSACAARGCGLAALAARGIIAGLGPGWDASGCAESLLDARSCVLDGMNRQHALVASMPWHPHSLLADGRTGVADSARRRGALAAAAARAMRATARGSLDVLAGLVGGGFAGWGVGGGGWGVGGGGVEGWESAR
jgi:hypothetical protein